MKRQAFLRAVTATALVVVGPCLASQSTLAAGLPVFDVTNYAQNVLQAARSLEQVNNQLASLQNEAVMLQNMARNLEAIGFPELERLRSSMDRIERVIVEARGIGFEAQALDRRIRHFFPGETASTASRDERVAGAMARLEAARAGFEDRLRLQAELAANLREDGELLSALVQRSQDSGGSLQVQQASNQLVALGIKQQLQVEELLAAEFQGMAFERARHVQAEEEGRARTRRFLGGRDAYSPPR